MWDSDALTEHLHKPAPQKSKANRVHIQKHALPHNMKMWWKNVIQCLQLQKPQLLLEIVYAIDIQYLQELDFFFKTSLTQMPVKLKTKNITALLCMRLSFYDRSLTQYLQEILPFQ